MIKTAKPSSDPVQEKLRQNKKIWNKQVSEFADNLFRLKDMMNGKPSKFYPEKSSIKEPIPGDPVTIIGALAGDFQEIAQKGNALVQEQLSYSKSRKKKQPKQTLVRMPSVPPAGDTSPTDLSKQLAAQAEVYEMVALGSNVFTRFFAHLLNPSVGRSPAARTRKYRMAMLKSAVEIYKDLVRLESYIVESSPESIFTSNRLLTKIMGNWDFFKTGIKAYNETYFERLSESGGEISSKEDGRDSIVTDTAKPASPKTKKPDTASTVSAVATPPVQAPSVPSPPPSGPDGIIDDYKKYSANFTDINMKELIRLIGKYRVEKGPYRDQTGDILTTEYANVLAQLNAANGTNGQSFKEIFEAKKAKGFVIAEHLEAVGQLAIQRWISKLKHQISPLDKTSAHRLDIYNAADAARKIIDTMMDSLEKEMNVDHLMKLAGDVDFKLKRMVHLMNGLEGTLRGKGFDQPFMDLLDSGKITNYGPNLNDDQRKRLQQLIDRRRYRDLADIYQGRR
jgi:hypothetical protein